MVRIRQHGAKLFVGFYLAPFFFVDGGPTLGPPLAFPARLTPPFFLQHCLKQVNACVCFEKTNLKCWNKCCGHPRFSAGISWGKSTTNAESHKSCCTRWQFL